MVGEGGISLYMSETLPIYRYRIWRHTITQLSGVSLQCRKCHRNMPCGGIVERLHGHTGTGSLFSMGTSLSSDERLPSFSSQNFTNITSLGDHLSTESISMHSGRQLESCAGAHHFDNARQRYRSFGVALNGVLESLLTTVLDHHGRPAPVTAIVFSDDDGPLLSRSTSLQSPADENHSLNAGLARGKLELIQASCT